MCDINCSGGCPECAPDEHYQDLRKKHWEGRVYSLPLRGDIIDDLHHALRLLDILLKRKSNETTRV